MQWQIYVLLALVACKLMWFGIQPLFTGYKFNMYVEGRLAGLLYIFWALAQAAVIYSLIL